jgi:hypothetical protein
MVNDNNLSIESIKYIDQFRYIIISTQAIYLYDLRYSQKPVSEFPFNINYKGINLKPLIVLDEFTEHNYYLGLDITKKDISHILFDICEEKRGDFYNNFANVNLIKSRSVSEDIAGILVDRDSYVYFSVDSFCTVNCNIMNLINTTNANGEGFQKLDSRFIEDGIECGDDLIVNLFKKNYHDYVYKKEPGDDNSRLNYENLVQEYEPQGLEDVENVSLEGSDESIEDEITYGYAKIKGKIKKLYEIKNNRALVEQLLDPNGHGGDVNMSEEEEGSLIVDNNIELNDTLKQILENFKL